MSLPVISVAGNGLLSRGHRFQIKGVDYIGDASGSTTIDVLADSRASQCAIDAPILKALGANTIRVYYTDATQGHDKCMQTFQDNGIYVIANMATQRAWTDVSSNIVNSPWQMGVFEQYAAVLDSMAGYSNLLGLLIGNNIISSQTITGQGPTVDLAPYLKAAARDMKAYAAARKYRAIPIGYATDSEYTYIQTLGEYLVCGGKSDEAIDFYAVNELGCNSSMSASDYDVLTSRLGGLGVPVIISETSCNHHAPRLFEVSTQTTLADYNSLKRWSAVTANTLPPPTLPTPSCPSINAYWPINPSAALPTIAGLGFATIQAAHAASTADGTRTSTSIRPRSTYSPPHNTSRGTMAGIGIGATSGVVLAFVGAFLFYRRQWKKKGRRHPSSSLPQTSGSSHQDAELGHIAVPAKSSHTDLPSQLPGSNPKA
ncbi:CAZyme family GH72 [Penicillium roqueforti]|uniref:CAZyme family GH72 n=1 Tax=Penicillium roqueforti TaxID=5082 RepID=UPI00190AC2F4|nr:CAZyme family GH72 [Penicillium roqueforti]KAF9245074.1 CAZyme family GH72 [Penicillium roqueforti]KAI2671160.1 CAZyme family GH72 [Penicillium roqueforti]KAI2671259.1 CAZyme family GH72 [Penicillium roqueforti]KAI2697529.1 CAZyme family GH72 [Penicillium roqueforti]KAI2710028.1 CAZyme family GH72 [Penicillium roqueforti]